MMLERVRVIEVEGIGPAPFASMLLADLGADVVFLSSLCLTEASAP